MSIPVLTLIPSMGVQQSLEREFLRSPRFDGYIIEKTSETAFSRSNGTGDIATYRGLNKFTVKYDSCQSGAGKRADDLWTFFTTRLDNINEPFYFYNPTELATPDPTGMVEIGRYYVKLADPNIVLSRSLFRNCLYSYGLTFKECKEFVA